MGRNCCLKGVVVTVVENEEICLSPKRPEQPPTDDANLFSLLSEIILTLFLLEDGTA